MEIMNLKGDEYIIDCIKIIMGIFESHFFLWWLRTILRINLEI